MNIQLCLWYKKKRFGIISRDGFADQNACEEHIHKNVYFCFSSVLNSAMRGLKDRKDILQGTNRPLACLLLATNRKKTHKTNSNCLLHFLQPQTNKMADGRWESEGGEESNTQMNREAEMIGEAMWCNISVAVSTWCTLLQGSGPPCLPPLAPCSLSFVFAVHFLLLCISFCFPLCTPYLSYFQLSIAFLFPRALPFPALPSWKRIEVRFCSSMCFLSKLHTGALWVASHANWWPKGVTFSLQWNRGIFMWRKADPLLTPITLLHLNMYQSPATTSQLGEKIGYLF